MIDYSIVIPVFNGEHTVIHLFNKLASFFEKTTYHYEIIFVYDCGNDNSWSVLLKLKEKYPHLIKLIKLSRNFGQHNALICGFEHAIGGFIITMDEDMQHDPEDIGTLIDKQTENNCDVVYGKYIELRHSFFRNISSKIFKQLIAYGIPELHKDYSAFRLIKASVAKETIDMRNSYTFLDGYLTWITNNVESCPVSHHERLGGVSSYNFGKLINHSINIFITFSNMPIRFLSKLSIVIITTMSIFAIYIICRTLIFNDLAMGYPSLILSIGFGVGLIMLALGIIGEYVYRINLKTTKRPNYKIDKVL